MLKIKKNIGIVLSIIIAMGLSLTTAGAGLKLETAWECKKNIVIAPEHEQTLTFPALKKKKGYVLCLAFKAYLYTPTPGGWNPYIAMRLNGTQLSKLTKKGNGRLLCRGKMFTSILPGDEKHSWWKNYGGKSCVMAYFGSGNIEDLDPRITSDRDEGYNYYFDISDTVNHLVIGPDDRVESDNINTLVLSNTLLKQYKAQMHYENIRIGYVSKELVDKSRETMLREFREGSVAATLRGDSFTLKVMKSGGMLLENNGDQYWFESLLSYPDPKGVKFSKLGVSASKGAPTWQPTLKVLNENEIELTAENKNVRLSRKIILGKERLSIFDTLTNISDKPAGVILRNMVGVKTLPLPGSFRLAGMDNEIETKCAANPTLFISRNASSVGVVAEDDIFRSGLELLKANNTFEASVTVGMAPGKSHTLEWSIYPLEDKNYFTLISKVRKNWKSNNTVPGPICLFDGDVIDQKIRKTNITLFKYWFEYEVPGILISREEYKKKFNARREQLRKINPDIKLLARTVTNLVTIDIRKIPGGDILPARKNTNRKTGKYGLHLTKEQTAVLDKTEYNDSLIRDADGNAVIDTFYVKYPYINLLVRLSLHNHRYKTLCEQIDYMLNEIKADGVYLDQFVPPKRFCSISYNKWDGCSVTLDKNGEINEKFYSYAITGAAARAAVLKRILDRGKLIMVNGQPVSKETQSLAVLRFEEMENDKINPMNFIYDKPPVFKWQANCQLGCPMILGQRIGYAKWYGTKDPGANLNKSIITALRNGLLYCYYGNFPTKNVGYGPVNHMFPFTPVKLGAGTLIGKERIITCLSGEYIWAHPEKPDCLLFDRQGFEKTGDFEITQTPKGWKVKVKLADWTEVATIE